jgi:hypothetical protein
VISGLGDRRASGHWSPVLVITLLYVGLTALIAYQLHYAIHGRPAIDVLLMAGLEPWPLELVRRGFAIVSTALCVALWVSFRGRRARGERMSALAPLLAALLLLALQWMVNLGLAPPEFTGELIRIL